MPRNSLAYTSLLRRGHSHCFRGDPSPPQALPAKATGPANCRLNTGHLGHLGQVLPLLVTGRGKKWKRLPELPAAPPMVSRHDRIHSEGLKGSATVTDA